MAGYAVANRLLRGLFHCVTNLLSALDDEGRPIQHIGYKTGIIIGLLVCASGAGLLYPSAEFKSYGLFLVALFVLASGTTILQIAAKKKRWRKGLQVD